MLILHPYCSKRPENQTETWDTLKVIREHYTVIDRLTDNDMDYPNFMRDYWTTDDIIVIEQDKVPTLADVQEIANCPAKACCFPYAVKDYQVTTRANWTNPFPYGLGFVKFTREVQLGTPPILWYGRTKWNKLDRAIEKPIIARFGPIHLHERWVKHNHGTGIVG